MVVSRNISGSVCALNTATKKVEQVAHVQHCEAWMKVLALWTHEHVVQTAIWEAVLEEFRGESGCPHVESVGLQGHVPPRFRNFLHVGRLADQSEKSGGLHVSVAVAHASLCHT